MSSLTNSNPLMNSGVLDDFQPRQKLTSTQSQVDVTRAERSAVKQVAQEKGFVIDNFTGVVRAKRNNTGKLSKSHTLRLYVQDLNRFQTWCNDNNYSQARGFEILLDRVLPSE